MRGMCVAHNGLGIVSNAAEVLCISVVRGMRGVAGVCEMCLARGGVGVEGGEWIRFLITFWEQGKYWTCVCVWVAVV